MARRFVIPFVENDEQDQLTFEWQGQNLNAFSTIKLHLTYESGLKLLPFPDAVIDDAAAGKFHFEFGPGDLVRGQHRAEVQFDDLSGKPKTLPTENLLILNVRPELA